MTTNEAIDLLKTIISIPSFSREENQVATFMEQIWQKEGYTSYRKGNNVWAKSSHWDDSKPTILLDAHIDTVKPNSKWEKDPFNPIVIDEKLYGLGSNDTGGSIVSMHAAFTMLDQKEQAYNLICLNSAEEESTGQGGILQVVDELGKIDFAIAGEPTEMQPAIAERGLLVLDCVAKGKAGHAARNEGINAIYEALNDIEWFRNYKFEKESPLLGAIKMSVTGINAGTQHNVIPAECSFMVDVRVNEFYSNHEIYDTICQHVKSEVKARSFTHNSSRTPLNHPYVTRCKELGLVPYGSPTTSNQVVMPYTSIKMGPGESARSHSANEFIKLDEIKDGIRIFNEVLDGLHI